MDSFFCKRGSVQKVAIIGAGVSGLTAIKACLEEDLNPVCFERSGYIGGLWAPRETNFDTEGFVFNSVVFNSCKEMSCFSDFPYPKSYPPYLRKHHQYEYLKSYADHFGLNGYIAFNTNVLEVAPMLTLENGDSVEKWRIRFQRLDRLDATEEEIFDAVMVCNGSTAEAVRTTFPDQDTFQGNILHSCHFREGSRYKDERVLVIGSSNSAGDVSAECSTFASRVFLSTRNGSCPLPRLIDGGIPLDAWINTLIKYFLPRFVTSAVLSRALSRMYDIKDIGLKPRLLDSLGPAFMINDEVVPRIISGMITPKPSVERFTEDGVIFSDGAHEEIDTVILATGYNMNFTFLDENLLSDNLNERSLYLHVFATTPSRPTLAVVGISQQVGLTACVVEMQARCAVAVFKGDVRLPCKGVMAKRIGETNAALIKKYGRLKYLVSAVPYICQLSHLIGCYPNFWIYLLKGDVQLASRLLFKPFYPYVTRLRGKHSWPGARRAIFDGMDNMFSATRISAPRNATNYGRAFAKAMVFFYGSYVLFRLIAINVEVISNFVNGLCGTMPSSAARVNMS